MIDPFDPTTDEDALLSVSAFFDGTATDVDRARVAADPELQDLLDELRSQVVPLRSVTPSDAVREQLVAAALVEYDATIAHSGAVAADGASSASEDGAPPAQLVRFERRRRWYAVVSGAAAAAVAVLFVGALVIGGRGDDEGPVAVDAPAAKSAVTASGQLDAPSNASASEAESFQDDATAGGSSPGGDVASSEEATTGTLVPMAVTEAAAAPTETSVVSADTITEIDAAAEVVSISSPDQLAAYARTQRAIMPLPGLGLPCVDEGAEAIGEVTYRGVAAIVVREPSTGEVRVHDLQDDCAVLTSVTP